jgi:hypothetical protein
MTKPKNQRGQPQPTVDVPDAAQLPVAETIPVVQTLREGIAFWVTMASIVIGILSTCLAIYFYEAQKQEPCLTFGVNPTKTELEQPDFDKDLGFSYGGQPINSDSVTAVQLCILNSGTKSIPTSAILDTIRIKTPDGSPILSARIKKTSRSICDIKLVVDRQDFKTGVCRIDWRILEPNDGAIIQLIYAGGAHHDPTLEGTIEGQRQGIEVRHFGTITLEKNDSIVIPLGRFIFIVVMVAIIALIMFLTSVFAPKSETARAIKAAKTKIHELEKQAWREQKQIWMRQPLRLVPLVVILLAILFVIAAVSTLPNNAPPFGW